MVSVEPLRIVLEFARANDAGDPHAFRFAPQSYLVRGERGDFTSAEVGWSRELLEDLEALRLPGRDPAALNRVGDVLRRTLEPAGWRQREGAIVDAVAEGRRVSVTVRSAAAELYALPWELLTLRSTGQSLGAVGGVLLRYEWPATSTARPRQRSAPGRGRILVAWSAAGGAVPATEHVAALREAFAAGGEAFDESRDVLEHASFGRLADRLAEAERDGETIDALHLLCHGGAAGSTFGLVFDGEDDGARSVVVDPSRIQQLLAPHAGMVRLVVVAACDSGNAGNPGNRLGSVAQMLHRVGVAAVVASRYPLSVNGSTRLTEVLYRELIAGERTLEEAFVRARTALARDPTTLDWASVQLYARADDGDATLPFGGPAQAPAAEPAALTEGAAVLAPGPTASGGLLKLGLVAAGVVVVLALGVYLLSGGLGGAPTTTAPEVDDTRAGGSAGEAEASGASVVAGSVGPDRGGTTGGGTTTGDAGTTSVGAASTGTAGTSGSSGGTTGEGSASGRDAPAQAAKKPKKKPPKEPETTVTTKCPSNVVTYIEDKAGAPEGGGAFSVRVKVSESGAVSMTSCAGCPDSLKAGARARMGKVSRERVKSKGGGALPCIGGFEWD